MKAAIVGIDGPELTPGETALLRAHPPAGVILFGRNIEGALPLARLVGDLREILAPEAVLMVDHEGGRVARLRPPDWRAHPSAAYVGACYMANRPIGLRLAWLTGALIGLDCKEAGFDVVCAPVLDLHSDRMTAAIGDRSYGADADQVVALAQSMTDGILSAGIQPVGKHAPGHGLAQVDSHVSLPRIGPEGDLAPEIGIFTACAGLPWMMTAHIVYTAIDPHWPATLSPIVIEGVIRGTIGFDGVLISDDLAMGALSGSAEERARAALAAGCDLALHCSGKMADLEAVLRSVPDISPGAWARMVRGRTLAEHCRLQLDRQMLVADQTALLAAASIPPELLT